MKIYIVRGKHWSSVCAESSARAARESAAKFRALDGAAEIEVNTYCDLADYISQISISAIGGGRLVPDTLVPRQVARRLTTLFGRPSGHGDVQYWRVSP